MNNHKVERIAGSLQCAGDACQYILIPVSVVTGSVHKNAALDTWIHSFHRSHKCRRIGAVCSWRKSRVALPVGFVGRSHMQIFFPVQASAVIAIAINLIANLPVHNAVIVGHI